MPKRLSPFGSQRMLGLACIALVLAIIAGAMAFGRPGDAGTQLPRTTFAVCLFVFVALLVWNTGDRRNDR
ncbi:MAG: hypothetical protein ACO1NQ_12465 [Flavobacteriales bacterium]